MKTIISALFDSAITFIHLASIAIFFIGGAFLSTYSLWVTLGLWFIGFVIGTFPEKLAEAQLAKLRVINNER